MKIILASKSPQRKTLLKKLNLNFTSVSSNINENIFINKIKNPNLLCKRLAIEKSKYIAKKYPNHLIIGADTIISLNNKILGKPKNKKEAHNYLNLLSDKKHTVYTGVSIINLKKNININFIDKTIVQFYKLNKNDIKYYINSFNPCERSGGYGIQDWSGIFIKTINGCYYNVVGFPLPKFYKLFKEIK